MNKFVMVAGIALVLAGCDQVKPNSDQVIKRQQEQLSMQGVMSVGMPSIVNFAEKRMMKDILEMRDQMHPTHTYLFDMNGKVGEKVCDSLGYGLSGATQFTNPQKIAESGHQYGYAILPQADPNGLFSPTTTEGTWVMCRVPGTDKIAPQYIEPRILVLTFPKESRK